MEFDASHFDASTNHHSLRLDAFLLHPSEILQDDVDRNGNLAEKPSLRFDLAQSFPRQLDPRPFLRWLSETLQSESFRLDKALPLCSPSEKLFLKQAYLTYPQSYHCVYFFLISYKRTQSTPSFCSFQYHLRKYLESSHNLESGSKTTRTLFVWHRRKGERSQLGARS